MKTDQKKAMCQPHQQKIAAHMGAALRSHRVVARLTQHQVAELAGVSRQTVSRIEQGDPSVSVGQIVRYADSVNALALFAFAGTSEASPSSRRVRLSEEERAMLQQDRASTLSQGAAIAAAPSVAAHTFMPVQQAAPAALAA